MKALFSVNGEDFESKQEAKEYRDMIDNGSHVSKGKDHKDFGVVRSSSIHPKRKHK